ncbi:FAD binding domain-containing protein [Candidatus Solirubrobacter pratensis]|uniref:FAD binding domain-containing protein n=1 Tax=Candidatus Solirubrobacter pratensis TaxID=1298857 RepID=UPI00048582BE
MQVPAPFGYERATSVDHALMLLEQLGPEARLLAGGHSLLPMMKLRLASPSYVVDIDPLADELGYVTEEDGEVRIGAMTRHNALLQSTALDRRLAIVKDAERVIADPVVRNRGTIGGALCQADPSEDLSAVCAALKAQMVIRATGGERVVGMREFHRGPYETAVGPAEMLVEIRVPAPRGSGSAYAKVDRRVGDWAVVAAGAALALEDGVIAGAGVALAAAGGDITSSEAEAALVGEPPSPELFARAAALAAAACEPVSDQRGSAEYKRHVAGVLTQRVLQRAAARALQVQEEV